MILFAPNILAGLSRVPAGGGTPAPATELDGKAGETSHRWPEFLPDGKHFVFFVHGSGSVSGIYLGSLDSKEHKLLVRTESSGAFAEPGYLLFVRDSTLIAQKMNLRTFALEGDAAPIGENASVNTETYRSVFTVSTTGRLLYMAGGGQSGSTLDWYGRDGKKQSAVAAEGAVYDHPALFPDGKRLAVSVESGSSQTQDIWVIDLERHTRSRLTFALHASFPVWSPDGKWIYYLVVNGANNGIYRRASDGTGSEEKLLEVARSVPAPVPTSISSDGKYLAYWQGEPKNASNPNVYVLPLSGDRKPIPQVASAFPEVVPRFSPDGKWLAYETYIKPFPGEGSKYQVSSGGGDTPYWRGDGRELFFRNGDKVMAVDVHENGTALQLGMPHELLTAPMVPGLEGPFVPAADGKRFLVNETARSQSGPAPLTLITNWTADLKK